MATEAAASARGNAGIRLGRGSAQTLVLTLAALPFVVVVGTPVLAIFARVLPSGALMEALGKPAVFEALRLSALTTTSSLALALILGTPLAYLLARRDFPGKVLLDSLVELPMV